MKIQDIIRGILDMIDGIEQPGHEEVLVVEPLSQIEKPGEASPFTHSPGDDINRWRQIVDLADSNDCEPYANTPQERYADIDSVTVHAGGGVNGPKDPADIKSSTISMYPDHVARRGE